MLSGVAAENDGGLVDLMGPEKGTSKSTEGNLEDEISKLLERKGGQAANESLSGDDEDEFDLDFSEDDLRDTTVYESNMHREGTESLTGEIPEDHNSFEELRFEQPNGNGTEQKHL